MAQFAIIDDVSGIVPLSDWIETANARHYPVSLNAACAELRRSGFDAELIPAASLFDERTSVFPEPNWCVVSLEAANTLPWADEYLLATRAVARPSCYGEGPFVLTARQGTPPLTQQLDTLAKKLLSDHAGKRVALIDDGFSGGLTFLELDRALATRGVEVRAFAAAINSRGLSSLGGIPVRAARSSPISVPWMNGRDFLFGMRGSGISVADTSSVVGGVPHFLLRGQGAIRLGLSVDEMSLFRPVALRYSFDWWRSFEAALGYPITVGDVSRLASIFRNPRLPVLELLEHLQIASDRQIEELLI